MQVLLSFFVDLYASSYLRGNSKYVERSAYVATPLAANDKNDAERDVAQWDRQTCFSLYRSIVGALLYMGHDRGDVAYTFRLMACAMQTEDSLRRLKRVVRYQYHTKRSGHFYPRCDGQATRESSSCLYLW